MTSSQHGAYVQGHTHTTMDKNSGLQAGNRKLIPEICPQFRLRAATRPHEAGLGSNRGSANRGEYVLSSCTHRPSSEQSRGYPKPRTFVAVGIESRRCARIGQGYSPLRRPVKWPQQRQRCGVKVNSAMSTKS